MVATRSTMSTPSSGSLDAIRAALEGILQRLSIEEKDQGNSNSEAERMFHSKWKAEPPPAGTNSKMVNGKTYYWCTHHKKSGTLHIEGLWCLHKQADCCLKGSQHSSSSTGGLSFAASTLHVYRTLESQRRL